MLGAACLDPKTDALLVLEPLHIKTELLLILEAESKRSYLELEEM